MHLNSNCLLNSLRALYFSFDRKVKTQSLKFQKSFKIQSLHEALISNLELGEKVINFLERILILLRIFIYTSEYKS